MYVFGSGRRRRRGSDWMRELGLRFTNPVGTGGGGDVCRCFGGVGDVGGECAWTRVWRRGDVCVSCESGLFVYMADPRICILC